MERLVAYNPPRDGPFTVDQFNEYASSLTGEGEVEVRLEFVGGRWFLPGSYVFYYSRDLIVDNGHFFGAKVGSDTKSVVFRGDEIFPFEINTAEFLEISSTRPKASVFFAFKNGEGRIDSPTWQKSLSGCAEVLIWGKIQTARTICLKCSGSLRDHVYDIQDIIRYIAGVIHPFSGAEKRRPN